MNVWSQQDRKTTLRLKMGWKDNKLTRVIRRVLNSTREKSWLKWLSRILWVGTILGLIALTITLIVVSKSNLPDFADLENPQYDLASIIYDAQGEPFGKYYIENREFIDYQDLSPHVVDALLSVEDARYMKHAGIDFRALFRVVFKSILLQQGSSGGGSTISQQLAKLLFDRASLRNKSKLQRAVSLAAIKMREWITAVRLERRYTKEEIIAMYLNKFEFINGAHGIQSASQIYFDKDQRELSITESAVLVGMLKNPARFNPVRFAERTEGRRNVVLSQMYKNDRLSRHLRDSLVVMPMDMSAFRKADQSAGLAPYFRAELTKWLRPLLLRPEFEKPEGGTYDIYRDGLQIYTTIDARYQEHAEDAVFEHLKELQRRYWRRWKGMDPFTYEIEDDEELQQLRYASVERRARDMEAYKSLYATMFGSLSDQARQTYGIELREPTVRRLVADREYVNLISANKQAFERLLSSNLWQEITRTWNEFSQSMEEMLDVEITSNMFSYDISDTTAQTMSRRDSLVYMIRHMQAGLLSVDPKSGEIKAWVGGPDHRYFKYDHVTMRRQVGSTIKPFVYATAIGVQGISPCQAYTDIQYTIAPGDADFQVDAEWSPSNSNGLFTQNDYNLYQGLLYSKNSITVRLVKELGTIEPIRELLHNVGIDKYERINDGRYVVPEVPSLVLGSVDLSVIEMAGAYTTFANDGVYTEPTFIDRIEDKYGKVIYQSSPIQRRAINKMYNSVMVDMLKNNVGGGYKLGIKSEAGGKTGTTNDYADGWFMGITPNLVTGIWVGGDEKWVRFYTLDDGQGFVMARPIFENYMKAIEADEEINFNTGATFPKPPPGIQDLIDCNRYKQIDPEEELESRLEQQMDLDVFDEIELEDEFEEMELEDDFNH